MMKRIVAPVVAVLLVFTAAAQETPVEKKDPVIHSFVDEQAQFPGGYQALKQYMVDNLVYPQKAKESRIQGVCQLQFVVSDQGKIDNVNMLRGIPGCLECDQEAIRLVKSMPVWTPAKNAGKPVYSTFNLPVRFKLDDVRQLEGDARVGTTDIDADPFVVPPPKQSEKIDAQEPEIFDIVDEPAEFSGGMAALKKYLADNLVYPPVAKEMNLQGKCYLKFVVSKEGNISNVKVIRGVPDCPECDREAIRIVKGMPAWTPGKISGKAVNSMFNLSVAFNLN